MADEADLRTAADVSAAEVGGGRHSGQACLLTHAVDFVVWGDESGGEGRVLRRCWGWARAGGAERIRGGAARRGATSVVVSLSSSARLVVGEMIPLSLLTRCSGLRGLEGVVGEQVRGGESEEEEESEGVSWVGGVPGEADEKDGRGGSMSCRG